MRLRLNECQGRSMTMAAGSTACSWATPTAISTLTGGNYLALIVAPARTRRRSST